MARPARALTIDHIAELAGVSTYVISCVLNNRPGVSESTRGKVQEIIQRHGYTRNYRRSKGYTVGLVLPGGGEDWYSSSVISGVMRYASESGINIATMIGESANCSDLTPALRKNNCDAAIVVLPAGMVAPMEAAATQAGIPVIMTNIRLDAAAAKNGIGFIDHDSRQGSFDLTSHLLALGHRDIAFLYREFDERDSNHRDRLAGWRDAMTAAGISPEALSCSAFELPLRAPVDLSSLIGKYSAIVAMDDLIAMQCLSYCYGHRLRVPEDLSITGFGNMKNSEFFSPPLTTVDQKGAEIGYLAARCAAELASGKRQALPAEIIGTRLIVRESTGTITERSHS